MKMRCGWLLVGVLVAVTSLASADGKGKGQGGEKDKAVKGSITAGKMDDAKLMDMAKISLADAVAAAVAKVPGKPWKAELEAEDGSLIFTVQVVTAAGEWKEVAVDAGNGAILNVETGDKDEFEGTSGKDKKECGKKEGGKDNDDEKD